VLYISAKGQAWYIDFGAGLLLFIVSVVMYTRYIDDFQSAEKGSLDILIKEADAVSSSLILPGFPNGWDNSSVVRAGIADMQRVNSTKLAYLMSMGSDSAKSRLSTAYNFYVFFEDRGSSVINIAGICGAGYTLNSTFASKSAYYFPSPNHSIFYNISQKAIQPDLYSSSDLNLLLDRIGNYSLVVLEYPSFDAASFAAAKPKIENYVSGGGKVVLTGQVGQVPGLNFLGCGFFKKAQQLYADRNSTVNSSDDYFRLFGGQNIVFGQAYYLQNTTAVNFSVLSSFTSDNSIAISKWKFGNGTAYYFSDFDASLGNVPFRDYAALGAGYLMGGNCNPADTSGIAGTKLVKDERYLIYGGEVVKMVVYLWA
jgi:hypothetical protein